ncbi:MAG: hypothetical protein RLY31_626 [Bacteroidota bacterium]
MYGSDWNPSRRDESPTFLTKGLTNFQKSCWFSAGWAISLVMWSWLRALPNASLMPTALT